MLEFFTIKETVVGGDVVVALTVEGEVVHATRFVSPATEKEYRKKIRRATLHLVKQFTRVDTLAAVR